MADPMAIRKLIQDLENAVWQLCQLDQMEKIAPPETADTSAHHDEMLSCLRKSKIQARRRMHACREALMLAIQPELTEGRVKS